MTASDLASKFRYEGNGSTASFSFPSRVFSASDLVVEIITRATDALEETLTITTDYTVTINGDESATVTTVSGKIPSSTQDIQIRRSLSRAQTLDLPTGTEFPAQSVEDGLDKLTAMVKEVDEVTGRCVRIPVTADTTIDTNISGTITSTAQVLQISTSGVSLGTLTSSSALLNFETETFDGNNSDVTFTLTTFTPASAASIEVSISGVLQTPVDDYTISGNDVTFASAPASGTDNILIRNLATGAAASTPGDDTVSTAKIQDSAVTYAKIQNVGNYKVLGNVSGSSAAPSEVSVLDEDNMASDSATALATQQSIKAYVDSAAGSGVLSSMTNLTVAGNVSGSAANAAEVTIYDEDTMSSNSDTALATQQSIKAYVDNNSRTGRLLARLVYTSSGTFTKATYPSMALVRVWATGGGGEGGTTAGGSNGGNSSFGTHAVGTGGSGGAANGTGGAGGTGGTGDQTYAGGGGGGGFDDGTNAVSGQGGASYYGGGGQAVVSSGAITNGVAGAAPGSGGSGAARITSGVIKGGGGGAGETSFAEVAVASLATSETVTVAGTAGTGAGGDGARGEIVVEVWT